MNYIVYSLLFVQLMVLTCQPIQEIPEQFIYREQTRGFQTEFRIGPDTTRLHRKGLDPVVVEIPTSPDKWKELLQAYNMVGRKSLSMEGSSEDLAVDRAPGASLEVRYSETNIVTPTWSSNAPPADLKPLVIKIQSLLKLVESQD